MFDFGNGPGDANIMVSTYYATTTSWVFFIDSTSAANIF